MAPGGGRRVAPLASLLLAALLGTAGGAKHREPQQPGDLVTVAPKNFRVLGYYDASKQSLLSLEALPLRHLTHIVVTNALTVDRAGEPHFRPAASAAELEGRQLIAALARLPARLVVSLRGYQGDVALDELAENETAREAFALQSASLLDSLGADGLEVEWHAGDPEGGKAAGSAFDTMEQHHFALLCRDLSAVLHSGLAGGRPRTLSVAVMPFRKEFADDSKVHQLVDWLTVHAHSMHSLADPHPSSLRDMSLALQEWSSKGVPAAKLVLGAPLFGAPAASPLKMAAARGTASRRPWRELSRGVVTDGRDGELVRDAESGKRWWVSGPRTTRAKVASLLKGGFGGVALRDLQSDATDRDESLVQAAADALREARLAARPRLVKGISLVQTGFKSSRTSVVDDEGADRREL